MTILIKTVVSDIAYTLLTLVKMAAITCLLILMKSSVETEARNMVAIEKHHFFLVDLFFKQELNPSYIYTII